MELKGERANVHGVPCGETKNPFNGIERKREAGLRTLFNTAIESIQWNWKIRFTFWHVTRKPGLLNPFNGIERFVLPFGMWPVNQVYWIHSMELKGSEKPYLAGVE